MGIFERYLSIWIFIAMAIGVISGFYTQGFYQWVAGLEYAHVNFVIALLIWVMIFPMMLQIDFASVRHVGRQPRGIILTLVVNWLIKPFSMAAIAVLFFKHLFAGLVDESTADEYIAGMILLGVAPCTAMVFVWSQLTKGDANYTLVQVSINDIIMIFAFAPIAGFLLGVSDIAIEWKTLLLSVGLYVISPLIAAVIVRGFLTKGGSNESLEKLCTFLKPVSIFGLILTVVILFGLQSDSILTQPFAILLIAIPLLLQTYLIFALSYYLAQRLKLPHNIAAPACMIGTSNFFELAVAVAISVFGLTSGAALATVVGVLVEVPVMLSLVYIANRTTHLFAHAQEH